MLGFGELSGTDGPRWYEPWRRAGPQSPPDHSAQLDRQHSIARGTATWVRRIRFSLCTHPNRALPLVLPNRAAAGARPPLLDGVPSARGDGSRGRGQCGRPTPCHSGLLAEDRLQPGAHHVGRLAQRAVLQRWEVRRPPDRAAPAPKSLTPCLLGAAESAAGIAGHRPTLRRRAGCKMARARSPNAPKTAQRSSCRCGSSARTWCARSSPRSQVPWNS